MRRIRVAVIGSGSDPHLPLCDALGRRLAENGYDLVNGGGGGVMEATARSFCQIKNRGLVIGILPAAGPCDHPEERGQYSPRPGYPNAYTDIPIRTHLNGLGASGKEITSRNHIVVLTGDIVIALPGAEGTRSEIELALEYRKPVVLLSPNDEWAEYSSRAPVCKTVDDVFAWVEKQV